MFETAGPLAIATPAPLLVLLVLFPALAALLATVAGFFAPSRPDVVAKRELLVGRAVVGSAVVTLLVAVFLVAKLGGLPRGYLLIQHVAQIVRLGQLDLALDFALDTKSASFVLLVALVSLASAAHATWSLPEPASRASAHPADRSLSWRLASSSLATTAAMLLCLGDGFAALLVALGVSAFAAWNGRRSGGIASAAAPMAGNAAATVGLFFLFWSLGGTFGPAGYEPDATPRFVLVATGLDPGNEKATLAMSSHAGALVASDDGPDLPGEPVTAPFAVTVEPGVYTFRIQAGAASADVVVPRVAVAKGVFYTLAPYGPTASLRSLADQIAVPRNVANGVPANLRGVLASRTLLGLRVSAVILFLVLGGALAHAHAFAQRQACASLAGVFEVLPPIYLATRLSPFVDAASLDGVLVSGLGVVSAFVLAAAAAASDDPARATRSVLAASTSIAVAAVGLGEPTVPIVIGASAVIAGAAGIAAIEARLDPRWLGVTCAAAAGLLPGAGVSSANALALVAAASWTSNGSTFAAFVAVVMVATWVLSALALFRLYDIAIRASSRHLGSPIQNAIVIALALSALLGGVLLGASTTPFGGSVASIARRLVGDPTTPPCAKAIAGLAVAASIGAAAGGIVAARRVGNMVEVPRWLGALDAPRGLLVRVGELGTAAAAFLARAVRTVDRDVLEDFGQVAFGVFVGVGSGIQRAERFAGGVPAHERHERHEPGGDASESRSSERATRRGILLRLVDNVAARFELDDPRRAERVRTVVVLAMVALLALVVLSSVLLG